MSGRSQASARAGRMGALQPAPRIAVIGGGITGLTAAWTLKQAGLNVVVFEAGARAGGAIGTLRIDEWLHELGPNALMENFPEVPALIEELGLAKQRVYATEAARKRFVVRQGKLCAMPASPFAFARTPLFSWKAKLELLREPFRRAAPMDREESVADFVQRRLGREFLDYAVNPFVGGVYAGDPRRLSVKFGFPKLWKLEQEHGSLIRGAIARRNGTGGPAGRMFSFRSGLQELPRTIEHLLGGAVRHRAAVQRVRRVGGGWEVEVDAGGGAAMEKFSAVIAAVPACVLAKIEFGGFEGAAGLAELQEIEHAPVASVFTGYKRSAVAHPLDGFGVLVPEVEGGRVLGTLFSSTLFPQRAPAGCAGLTTFVGGVRQAELLQRDDAALVELVCDELQRLVGAEGAPEFAHVQRWSQAIPQYTIGYGRFLATCEQAERGAPGLFIGGNGRDGISLGQCIASGRRLAVAARAHVTDLQTSKAPNCGK